jgi:hypothetical protein
MGVRLMGLLVRKERARGRGRSRVIFLGRVVSGFFCPKGGCGEWRRGRKARKYGMGRRSTDQDFPWIGFSKYAVVDSRCCVKVGEAGDKSIDLSKLAPLGCGIMTGAGGTSLIQTPQSH